MRGSMDMGEVSVNPQQQRFAYLMVVIFMTALLTHHFTVRGMLPVAGIDGKIQRCIVEQEERGEEEEAQPAEVGGGEGLEDAEVQDEGGQGQAEAGGEGEAGEAGR